MASGERPQLVEGFEPTGLRFPSDAINMGQMRAHDPELRLLGHGSTSSGNIDALCLHGMELRAAESAYAIAAGITDPHAGRTTLEDQSLILRSYVRYGIAKGTHEAKQMFKDMQQQAADQAQSRGGQGR